MIHQMFATKPALRQRGMTLIEILVAIVVLSLGLMGLAGLQLKGMQVNQGSTYRSQAAILAQEMAERIRADLTGAGNSANTQLIDVTVSWVDTRAQTAAGLSVAAASGAPGSFVVPVEF